MRQLSIQELQHALAVDSGDTDLDIDNLVDEFQMVSVCAGLVTMDAQTNSVRFVHYTTQDFFENIEKEWLFDAHISIARTCITCLSFDTLSQGPILDWATWNLRLHENPFLEYATRYWGFHAFIEEARLVPDISSLSFLTSDISRSFLAPGIYAHWFQFNYAYADLIRCLGEKNMHLTPIHILGQAGLSKCVAAFLERGYHPDLKDQNQSTPLYLAAEAGRVAVVALLADREDVDVNSRGVADRTPLHVAAQNGHDAVVALLVACADVDVNCIDEDGCTPLHKAISRGHDGVVAVLLRRRDLDVNLSDDDGETSLFAAALHGQSAVVALLLSRDGIEVNSRERSKEMTPLLVAADYNFVDVVALLLNRDDVDVNLGDSFASTPLSAAMFWGNDDVVKLMLGRGDIDVNVRDQRQDTPLMIGVKRKCDTVVRLLLARSDVDVNLKNQDMETPLLRAVRHGYVPTLELLLGRDDIDLDAKDSDGCTALENADTFGFEIAVKLLREKREFKKV